MPHIVQIALDEKEAADEILHRLRGAAPGAASAIENACVVQCDARGKVHLKQAMIEPRRQGGVWRRLVRRVLRKHDTPPSPSAQLSGLGLGGDVACGAAAALRLNTSILLLRLRVPEPGAVIDLLRGHTGKVLHCDLAGMSCDRLAAVLAAPPSFPSAAELGTVARQAAERRRRGREGRSESEEQERAREIERLKNEPLSRAQLEGVMAVVTDAAKSGRRAALVYRFPSQLCTDGGRAINNEEPAWPDTLTGQPRQFYDFWRQHLRREGYRLRVQILTYPGGVLGDVGLTLAWD